MTNIKHLHEQAEELETLLRLQSFPLGLKLLKSVDEIPEGAQRPVKDMGHHLSLCQALALARRAGMTVAETKEDMWCFEPVLGLGFEKPPQRFLDGYHRYPLYATTLEAGATWAKAFPCLDHGLYTAVVTAPLAKVNFEPDLFIVYGEPAKIGRILSAKTWLDGKDITTTLSSGGACVYSVVPVMKDKGWHIITPCGGDLGRAACETYNMIFSAPIEVLDDLLRGLRVAKEKGQGLPRQVDTSAEYPLAEPYVEIGKLIGMDWVKVTSLSLRPDIDGS